MDGSAVYWDVSDWGGILKLRNPLENFLPDMIFLPERIFNESMFDSYYVD
jgi:hypothetical protein